MGQVSFSLLRWLQFFFCFVLLVFFFFYRREVSSAGFPEYQEFQFLSVEFLTPSFLALEFRQAGKCIASIFKILLLSPPRRPSRDGYDSPAAETVATCGAKKLNQKRLFLFLFLFILFPDHSPTQASGVLRITFYRYPYTARALG